MGNNNLINTEEKIKRKYKSLNELIVIILIFLFIPFLIMIFIFNPVNEVQYNQASEYIQSEDYKEYDIIEIFINEHPKIFSTFYYIVSICSFACLYSLLIIISKMCKEIQNTGKPFSDKTLKYMNILTKVVALWAIISLFNGIFGVKIGIGLIPASILCVLKYIFEYGYKLQIESDETL